MISGIVQQGLGASGIISTITGSSVCRAGGGGAGNSDNDTRDGRCGGGHAGYYCFNNAQAGGANTGGGGGGGNGCLGGYNEWVAYAGNSGGSGVVIVRHSNTYSTATTTGSPTFVNTGGFKIYTFTGSGSIVWNS
jgi:hypothetical protein